MSDGEGSKSTPFFSDERGTQMVLKTAEAAARVGVQVEIREDVAA